MQIVGNVISVNLNTKIAKQGGGTYDAWEVVYRSPENEVKQLAKPVQSLKFTKGLKDGLESLVVGAGFVAELEKNARDYWEVQTIRKADAEEVVVAPAVVDSRPAALTKEAPAPRATSGKVTGSNYETPEERAKKQVVIIRQSNFAQALAFLVAQPDPKVITLENVIDVAKDIEKFVHKDLGKAATKYIAVKIGETE